MWYFLWSLHEVDKDIIAFPIGYDDTDAILGQLTRCHVFRMHTSSSEGALLHLDVLAEVGAGLHVTYQF